MKKLVAGPWVGEFGWELMSWQGWLRAMAPAYDRVVVCAPAGHKVLYGDFAHEYVPHAIRGKKDCWRMVKFADQPFHFSKITKQLERLGGTWVRPKGFVRPSEQRFVAYGDAASVSPRHRCDVLLHARHPVGKRPYHAWDREDASRVACTLSGLGLKVGCIGTEAYAVAGASDLRGLPLDRLVDIIAAAGAVVSPASGPILLSGLCRTPFVCWTDNGYRSAVRARDATRIKGVWNPLETPCRVLVDKRWKPKVDDIVGLVEETLRGG